MNANKRWLALVAALIALLMWLIFLWTPTPDSGTPPPSPPHAKETPAGGDFTLQSPDGPVSLHDFRGKVVLLYFGYTFCPDICPTSLSLMAQALSALTPDERRQTASLFVSVDPERDTLEILKAYVPFFHPEMVGLNGTPEQVAQVARQYGVRYMKQPSRDGAPYSVDHTAFTYVIAPDGKLIASLRHGTPAQAIVDIIRARIRTGQTESLSRSTSP